MALRLHHSPRSTPVCSTPHRHPANRLPRLVAAPLCIVASLLLLCGLLGASLLPLALGAIGLAAALALQASADGPPRC